jgi:hypothetical protein
MQAFSLSVDRIGPGGSADDGRYGYLFVKNILVTYPYIHNCTNGESVQISV